MFLFELVKNRELLERTSACFISGINGKRVLKKAFTKFKFLEYCNDFDPFSRYGAFVEVGICF